MIVFICIDDRGGMLFNHRRQSRDREQVADMLSLVGNGHLLCHPYSATLFPEEGYQPVFDEHFLENAAERDFCFVENQPLVPCLEKIQALIVYRWNRTYPRDVVLDIPLPGAFHPVETVEFAGYSHEKITRVRYER